MNNIKKTELGFYYNDRAIKTKDINKRIIILKEAVLKSVETPYTYDKLSILLIKTGKKKGALKVCEKYEKIMNKRLDYRKNKGYSEDMSLREKSIIKRMEKLRKELE